MKSAKSKGPKLKRTELLNFLWDCQRQYGYIRDEDVAECADRLGWSQIEVEGVISFYHFFHRKPTGKFIIYLNNSIVSEVKGFERVKEAFERETGTTFNAKEVFGPFALFETACIGLSDQEPAALINFHPFTNLNSLKVRQIIEQLKRGVPVEELCDEVPDNIRYAPPEDKRVFFREYRPGIAVSKLPQMTPEQVIEQIKKSNLRGMGGAFFPVGLKWELCRKEPNKSKYIVCNADEGEPGTFKDRVLMNFMPGLMLEGLIISGYAVGAKVGIVYLRAEYFWMLDKLEKKLDEFRRKNLLGKNIQGIKGFDFDIRIQLGAGAYVCGEETALLNSLEGRRGEARPRQYYPTQRGLFNQPTVVNNVETLCAAARVLELGADHFKPGTKLLSISGDCHMPGIYEIEWGTTVAEVLELCEADDPYFIQVSGPSGECISMKEAKRKISREDLPCGGSFMIFNSQRDINHILSNFTDFFKEESCGLCTPCRAGNYIIRQKLERINRGLASDADLEDIRKWGNIMSQTSRCGLGRMATRAHISALDKFPTYFKNKIDQHGDRLNREFDIERAIQSYEKFRN
jgi:[NiFe] hydrogenase diaphorase moiety large subunit